MGALAKFKTKKKPARRAVSKYSGVTPAEDRDPILGDSDEKGVPAGARTLHRVRVIGTEEFDGEKKGGTFFRAKLEIIQSSCYQPGETRAFLQCITKGNALRVGGPKVMSFVQTAAGFEDFGAFCEDKDTAEDATGDGAARFVDACGGDPAATEEFGENPLEGQILDVVVTPNGAPKRYENDNGEEHFVQYYNYVWSLPEEEEEEAPKPKKKAARR